MASSAIAAPIVAGRVLGDRARDTLAAAETRLAEHNDAIVTVVLLLLGTVLLGNGLAGLG